MRRKNIHRSRKAFTLMEIMMVVAMLGLLMTLVITNLDGVFDQGERKTTEMYLNNTVKSTFLTYKSDMGKYPSTEDGLQAFLANPSDSKKWHGPYVDKMPVDPWGNVYKYACPGEHNPKSYDIWSMGPDGIDGTDDDIGNWTVEE